MKFTWIIMPLIGALIGWITNVVAIKMLFWPKQPIRIPLTSIELMGLLPKRRKDLASSIGQAIDESLLPIEEVLSRVEASEYQQYVIEAIIFHVDQRLVEILPRVLPGTIKTKIRVKLKDLIQRESVNIIEQVSESTIEKIKQNAQLGNLVEEKIQSFDLEQLESLIMGISSTELKHIELLGAILGLLIGIIQALLVYLQVSL